MTDQPSVDRDRLETERLQSEIELNRAQVQKLKERGFMRYVAIILAVAATTWVFVTTFAGFLTDLSDIAIRELPELKEQIQSIQQRNYVLESEVRNLNGSRERADSLESLLRRAQGTILRLNSSPDSVGGSSIVPSTEQPWLAAIFLVEVDGWKGPLILALQDDQTGTGNPSASGYLFHQMSAYGREVYGDWSLDSNGIVITDFPLGFVADSPSEIRIDLTDVHRKGEFQVRWESQSETGSGAARLLGHLPVY